MAIKKIIIIISRSILSQLQYQLFISIFWSMIWGIEGDVVFTLDCWLSELMTCERISYSLHDEICLKFHIWSNVKKCKQNGGKIQSFLILTSELVENIVFWIEISSCHFLKPELWILKVQTSINKVKMTKNFLKWQNFYLTVKFISFQFSLF